MDRWRINIEESLLASTWPSAGVKVIGDWGIGKMMMLGHCLLVLWSQQSRCLFPERDVNDYSRKPCRVAVPCVKYWRISIRMQEKVLVAGRENALFEGKELYMSRHFLSQPCRSREDDQKAGTVHEK